MKRLNRNRLRDDSSVTEEELAEELKGLEAKLKAATADAVKTQVEASLRTYKVAALAFAAGFALFLTIGFISRGQLFEIVVKSAYPPESIHNDLKPKLNSTVWSTVTTGTKEDYEKFVSRDEFYEALRQYHTDLVKTFLLPTRERAVRSHEVLQAGKTPLDAQVLMVGKEYDGKPTARCHQEFKDKELQAIVVIPKNADLAEFAWLDCAFGWPRLTLGIRVGSKELQGLRLVGVRRNGGTQNLQVLLSQESARQLELANWQSHKASAFGKLRVVAAE